MHRKSSPYAIVVAALVLSGAAAGCAEQQPPNTAGAEVGTSGASVADEETGGAADEVRAFHRHHHIGFIGFALESIPSLGVPPEKEAAIEKIRQDIRAKFQPAYQAEVALLEAVAEGVAAGKMDPAKIEAATAKIAEISTQMDDATNDALNQLHAALAAPEREALVMKVQAHFMIWYRANAEAEMQPDQEQEGGHIRHLVPALGLLPDQVEKIDAAFTDSMKTYYQAKGTFPMKDAKDHLDAFVKAFPADSFDAKTLTTADKANSAVTTWGAIRMARFYEAMLPVLTPDQRTKLATLLRDQASKLGK
jgi:Spy/CpxP family protein refolding chaperone